MKKYLKYIEGSLKWVTSEKRKLSTTDIKETTNNTLSAYRNVLRVLQDAIDNTDDVFAKANAIEDYSIIHAYMTSVLCILKS